MEDSEEERTEGTLGRKHSSEDGECLYWVLRGANKFEDALRGTLQTATQQRAHNGIFRKNRKVTEDVT